MLRYKVEYKDKDEANKSIDYSGGNDRFTPSMQYPQHHFIYDGIHFAKEIGMLNSMFISASLTDAVNPGTYEGSFTDNFGGGNISDSLLKFLGISSKEVAIWYLNSIANFESGRNFTDALKKDEELNGKDYHDGTGGHRTYAYGLVLFKNKYLDQMNGGRYTEGQLKQMFVEIAAEHFQVVKKWANRNNVKLSERQMCALAHFHHWAPGVAPSGRSSDPYWDCIANPFRFLEGNTQGFSNLEQAWFSIFTTGGKGKAPRNKSRFYNGWKRRYWDWAYCTAFKGG